MQLTKYIISNYLLPWVFRQNGSRILVAPSGAAENSLLFYVTQCCWQVISNVLRDRSASIFRVNHSNLNYPATAWGTTRPAIRRHIAEDFDLFHTFHMSCPFHHAWRSVDSTNHETFQYNVFSTLFLSCTKHPSSALVSDAVCLSLFRHHTQTNSTYIGFAQMCFSVIRWGSWLP